MKKFFQIMWVLVLAYYVFELVCTFRKLGKRTSDNPEERKEPEIEPLKPFEVLQEILANDYDISFNIDGETLHLRDITDEDKIEEHALDIAKQLRNKVPQLMNFGFTCKKGVVKLVQLH